MVSLQGIIPDSFNPKDYSNASEYLTGGNAKEAFRNEMLKHGLKPPTEIVSHELMRFPDSKDKGHKKSGWCIFFDGMDDSRSIDLGHGQFGSHHESPPTTFWSSKRVHAMTKGERERYEATMAAAKLIREKEAEERHKAAKEEAAKLWDAAGQPMKDHQYLKQKQIKPNGAKQNGQKLLIPIYDGPEELCSLQRIFPNGDKRFLAGGKIKGCYGIVGDDTPTKYIAEGYSTAETVHEATGSRVYIAFNAGNLYEVSARLKAEHPADRLIIAADNDYKNEVNIGKNKAEQAAKALGLEMILPEKEVDFNDMAVTHGMEEVKSQLNFTPKTYQKKEEKEQAKISDSVGVLSDIIGYYNATSGNDQPEFAVQTALALGSLLLGRNFRTNKNNYTSMYYINVAKSGTGKEHSKSVMEDILHAAEMDHLLSGDGYTSAGGVFSGLLEKPRHGTVIDEFGKYLEAARKSGNNLQAEANSQLMQAITRCNGIMRPPVYSAMGVSAEKRKEMQSRLIHNPALTILAMTTPSTMFDAMDIGSISDGFLNRFIVCISDAKRVPRVHKDSVPVPKRITDWIETINSRIGDKVEVASERPDPVELIFTDGCMDLQYDFQLRCIKRADDLESMRLSETPMRANEMAMKMSLICALARDPWAERVVEEDMQWSIDYVEKHLDRLIGAIKMNVSSSGFEGDKKEILLALRELGDKGATWTHMMKRNPFSKHKRRDLQEILDSLVDGNLIHMEERKPDGRGRPANVYVASE